MLGGMDIDYIRARGAWAALNEQPDADRRSEERIAAAVRGMLALSRYELEQAIAAIRSERCLHCGSDDPRCYCMRDE